MRTLYVSKALVTAVYREKLRALAVHANVTAVCPDRWGRQRLESPAAGVPWLETRRALLHGHNHLHLYVGARHWLAAARPELVHIDEEPYSAVTFQLGRHCRRMGVPWLFFAWQNLDKRLPPPFRSLRAAVFRGAAGAIAGTERAAEVLRDAGYGGPLAVIPQFGVDPIRFAPDPAARARTRARLGIADAAFTIGFGGRLVPEKGVHQLIEAVATIPGAHLLVLGDGPERSRLARAAAAAGLAERTHFAGQVPSLEMPGWLAALDTLALPSRTSRGWVEQFGRILVEAMACGVPVVGSDSGEIPRVIGDAGVVVPESDTAALAAALRALADSPAHRAALARRARDRVRARFTHERVAADTARFYASIIRNGSRR